MFMCHSLVHGLMIFCLQGLDKCLWLRSNGSALPLKSRIGQVSCFRWHPSSLWAGSPNPWTKFAQRTFYLHVWVIMSVAFCLTVSLCMCVSQRLPVDHCVTAPFPLQRWVFTFGRRTLISVSGCLVKVFSISYLFCCILNIKTFFFLN